MRLLRTIAAALVLLPCAGVSAEPVTLMPSGLSLATRLPIPGDPPRCYSKLTVDAVELRPGAPRSKLLLKATFSAPVAGKGAPAPRDGWFRALDESGLVHLLTPVGSLEGLSGDGAEATVFFQADVPGSPSTLRLLVGPPLQPDGGVRLDFAKKTAAPFKPAARDAFSIAWPALEKTAAAFLPDPSAPALHPRLTLPLSGVAPALHRDCLAQVSLLIPAAQVKGSRLSVVRAFVNRGAEAGCEVPNDLFYADDVGALMPPGEAYLAAAPAFASYLDVVEVELPPHAERGHIFLSEASGQARTEVVAQLRLDLARRQLTVVEDVEGLLVDAADGKPLAGVELWLRGSSDWRRDRELVRQARSGPDGRFRFERVEPGSYVVSGRAEAREVRHAFAQAAAGSAKLRVELEIQRPAPGYIGVVLRERPGGVYVEDVMRHSGAARAGLEPEDRIVAVDGAAVATLSAAHARIPGRPGTRVRLEVDRGGKRMVLQAVRTQR
ncbi:MAG: PDZ domain-containing protein [Myxococcales bacterium]